MNSIKKFLFKNVPTGIVLTRINSKLSRTIGKMNNSHDCINNLPILITRKKTGIYLYAPNDNSILPIRNIDDEQLHYDYTILEHYRDVRFVGC